MDNLDFDALNTEDELPAIEFGPISRHTLALYCGGSGDHNPIHVDTDFAKAAGFDDVFAHGMLSMAVLGRVLTNWVPQEQIKSYNVRFTSITQVQDVIHASAKIAEKTQSGGINQVVLDVATHTQSGTQTLTGRATITF